MVAERYFLVILLLSKDNNRLTLSIFGEVLLPPNRMGECIHFQWLPGTRSLIFFLRSSWMHRMRSRIGSMLINTGHASWETMWRALSRQRFFPGMTSACQAHIYQCGRCQATRPRVQEHSHLSAMTSQYNRGISCRLILWNSAKPASTLAIVSSLSLTCFQSGLKPCHSNGMMRLV